MKKSVLFILLILSVNFSFAQKNTYTTHKGDTWYSIARKFNISYAELRMANKSVDDKLPLGKKLVIPAALKANDPYFEKNKMDQKADKKTTAPGKQFEHRIHIVSGSETLFSIAKKYNISVDDLKKWNNLRSAAIRKGQVLTIHTNTADKIAVIIKDEKEEAGDANTIDKKAAVPPATEGENKSNTSSEPEKKSIDDINHDSKSTDKTIIFAGSRKEVNETGVAAWIEDEAINPNKYYALHRSAPIGTIIKVINRMNNRSVYVKVVGKLPQTGDNDGLIIKISKAGADKLGVLDNRFQTQLVYGVSVANNQ